MEFAPSTRRPSPTSCRRLPFLLLWAALWPATLAGAEPALLCGACETSFECAEGLNCIGARCKTPSQCCLDQDCPTGQSCVDHACKVTDGGTARCGQCTTSFQCGEDMNCIGERCRDAGQCCLDQDCPAGQSCRDHACTVTGGNVGQCGRCASSFECSGEMNCVGARCRNDGQCCLDQDCPSGLGCVDHQCKKR